MRAWALCIIVLGLVSCTASLTTGPKNSANRGARGAPSAPSTASSAPPPSSAATSSEKNASVEDEPEDSAETPDVTERGAVRVPHPLDAKSSKQLETALLGDHNALGSMSIGTPNAGKLFAATRMPESEHWTLVDPAHAWGTRETVQALARCIEIVNAKFPHTLPVFIGHISADRGGPLSPHVSHQAGRDADVGYYYLRNARWYARADAKNLDRARTWAFVRALITETDVELILIDHSIQRLLEEHARSIGEDPAWLDGIFRGSGKVPPLIRHANGHATHLHVRFYSPLAQETARRALDILVRHDLIDPPQQFVHHRAKDGETLAMLARKYGTTIGAIKTANGLKTNKIRAKKTYLIPRRAAFRVSSTPVAIPPRRLPPRAPIG